VMAKKDLKKSFEECHISYLGPWHPSHSHLTATQRLFIIFQLASGRL